MISSGSVTVITYYNDSQDSGMHSTFDYGLVVKNTNEEEQSKDKMQSTCSGREHRVSVPLLVE
jgi:hypothetical protein